MQVLEGGLFMVQKPEELGGISNYFDDSLLVSIWSQVEIHPKTL